MRSEIRRAGLKCKRCKSELLVLGEIVICQLCNCQVEPKGMIEEIQKHTRKDK